MRGDGGIGTSQGLADFAKELGSLPRLDDDGGIQHIAIPS
jgi:hypothetical protein